MEISLEIECKSCNGTGLYVGTAEREGSAVICTTCEGTGCQDYNFGYTLFIERKIRNDVRRVFKRSCGYVHSADDQKGIEFSKGGVLYADWIAGKVPKPIKSLYCPLQWTGQEWSSPLYCKVSGAGMCISECPYRKEHGVMPCWDEYENQGNT